jgi:hypothetical protein
MCLVVQTAEKFLRVFMFPSCGRQYATGIEDSIYSLCNNTAFRLCMEESVNSCHFPDCTRCSLLQLDPRLTYKDWVHLVLRRTAQSIVGAKEMLSFAQCSPEYSTVESWRQQFYFILRQLEVSDEVRKFFQRDVVWFSRGYIQEKFLIVRWAVTRSYVMLSVTWKPEPVLSFQCHFRVQHPKN